MSNVSAVGAALRNATNDDDVAIFYPNDTKDYLQMGLLLILLAICILLKVCNAPCCKLSTIKVIPSFSASSRKKLPAPPWAKKSGAGEAGDGAIVPAAAAKHFASVLTGCNACAAPSMHGLQHCSICKHARSLPITARLK